MKTVALKVIVLPRQARDKHSKSAQKQDPLSQVSADGESALVVATVTLANDGAAPTTAGEGKVTLTLCKRAAPVPAHLRPLAPENCQGLPTVASTQLSLEAPLAAGAISTRAVTFELSKPSLWDPEHPNLHTLQVDLDGDAQQTAIRLGAETASPFERFLCKNDQLTKTGSGQT